MKAAVLEMNMEPTTKIETVNVATATKWLEANTHNRPVRQRHVEFLAEEIRRGAWRLTNQGIAFDTAGTLVDGQHRLWAIITADTPIRIAVTRGLDINAMNAIDVGIAPRSVGDVFIMSGDALGRRRAETLNMIRLLVTTKRAKMGVDEARELEAIYGDGASWALAAIPDRTLTAPSAVRAALAFAYKTNPAEVAEFAQQLTTGVSLAASDPAYLLRELLLGRRNVRANYDRRTIAVKTLRALVAYLHKEPIKNLYATEESIQVFAAAYAVDMRPSKRTEKTSFIGAVRRKAKKAKASK